MALADLVTVKKRVIQILNANPSAFLSTVSGDVGAFPYDAEIEQGIFEAEATVIREGYFNSVNESLRQPFMNIYQMASGVKLPFHYGKHGKARTSLDDITYKTGIEAAHVDDVIQAIELGAYVGANAFSRLYKVWDGIFYYAAPYGRIDLPLYLKTSVLQLDQNETFLLVATAVKVLTKNASPAPFDVYRMESEKGIQQLVQDGFYSQQVEDSK